MYKLYADGGCAPKNPGPGGFGFRLEAPDGTVVEGYGNEDPSTNNRMEILAATHGMRAVPQGASVELICDSQYVLNGCSQWRKGWQARNMRKADGEPVLNGELWVALWAEVDKRQVKYTWVRGHTGNAGNERADELAGVARSQKLTMLPVASPAPAQPTQPSPVAYETAEAAITQAPAAPAAISQTETMLMSLLSAKFGPMLRKDAVPAYKEVAAGVVTLLKRLNWTPPT